MRLDVVNIGEPVRLDIYISEKLGMSRNRAQKIIKNGLVVLKGAKGVTSSTRLKEGSVLDIELPRPVNASVEPEDVPLDIIYEDSDVLVLNKKAGMIVHPTPVVRSATLVNALLFRLGRSFTAGSPERPGIVHRLDKDTSGIMVVAKSSRAYDSLVGQFVSREIHKKYTAVVCGDMKRGGEIETFFGRHPRFRKKMSVWGGLYGARRAAKAKKAVTAVRVLERLVTHTALEVSPLTGRTHQIRVHLAYLGHPVLGDSVYGSGKSADTGAARQMLHATSIRFRHPVTEKEMEFSVPLPDDMKKVLETLKRSNAVSSKK